MHIISKNSRYSPNLRNYFPSRIHDPWRKIIEIENNITRLTGCLSALVSLLQVYICYIDHEHRCTPFTCAHDWQTDAWETSHSLLPLRGWLFARQIRATAAGWRAITYIIAAAFGFSPTALIPINTYVRTRMWLDAGSRYCISLTALAC